MIRLTHTNDESEAVLAKGLVTLSDFTAITNARATSSDDIVCSFICHIKGFITDIIRDGQPTSVDLKLVIAVTRDAPLAKIRFDFSTREDASEGKEMNISLECPPEACEQYEGGHRKSSLSTAFKEYTPYPCPFIIVTMIGGLRAKTLKARKFWSKQQIQEDSHTSVPRITTRVWGFEHDEEALIKLQPLLSCNYYAAMIPSVTYENIGDSTRYFWRGEPVPRSDPSWYDQVDAQPCFGLYLASDAATGPGGPYHGLLTSSSVTLTWEMFYMGVVDDPNDPALNVSADGIAMMEGIVRAYATALGTTYDQVISHFASSFIITEDSRGRLIPVGDGTYRCRSIFRDGISGVELNTHWQLSTLIQLSRLIVSSFFDYTHFGNIISPMSSNKYLNTMLRCAVVSTHMPAPFVNDSDHDAAFGYTMWANPTRFFLNHLVRGKSRANSLISSLVGKNSFNIGIGSYNPQTFYLGPIVCRPERITRTREKDLHNRSTYAIYRGKHLVSFDAMITEMIYRAGILMDSHTKAKSSLILSAFVIISKDFYILVVPPRDDPSWSFTIGVQRKSSGTKTKEAKQLYNKLRSAPGEMSQEKIMQDLTSPLEGFLNARPIPSATA